MKLKGLLFLSIIWVFIGPTKLWGQFAKVEDYDFHFVTPEGIQDSLWPGREAFSDGTYFSIIVDEKEKKIYVGLQGNTDYFSSHPLSTGEEIPANWRFAHNRGHLDMYLVANPEFGGNSAFVKGGGMLLKQDAKTGEKFLEFKTRTRSIQGVRREIWETVIFEGQRRSIPGFRPNSQWDDNGLLTPSEAKKIAQLVSNGMDLEVRTPMLIGSRAGNLKLGFSQEKESKVLQGMKEEAQAVAQARGDSLLRFHYISSPQGLCSIVRRLAQ